MLLSTPWGGFLLFVPTYLFFGTYLPLAFEACFFFLNLKLLAFLGYLILNGINGIIYLALFISMVFLAIVKYLTILI
jgi:hypothetical protein